MGELLVTTPVQIVNNQQLNEGQNLVELVYVAAFLHIPFKIISANIRRANQ